MSSSEPRYYRVVVRHNMVVAIETLAAAGEIQVARSPLEASSELARNHQANGCLDGEYCFDDAETARRFAMLGLDFMRRMADKATEHLSGSHIAEDGWRNPTHDVDASEET